jgi:Flp pilus assembly protein TadD
MVHDSGRILPAIKWPQKAALTATGLVLSAVLVEMILRTLGFIVLLRQERRNFQSARQVGAYRVMCVGESTTQNQYPAFLEEILNRRGAGIRFSVIDRGMTGANTTDILARLESDIDRYRPETVIAMIGVNDDGKHIPYETDFRSRTMPFLKRLRIYKLGKLLQSRLHADGERAAYRDKRGAAFANDSALMKTGWRYISEKNMQEAQRAFKRAAETERGNDSAYMILGWLSIDQKRYAEVERSFKKALELNPRNESAYIELGWLYRTQRRFSEAEQLFKKGIALNPESARLHENLAALYYRLDEDALSKSYSQKASLLRRRYYNPRTVENYLELKRILDSRGVRLVCVQYPMRDLSPLKQIFEDAPGSDVLFVDNERTFEAAVRAQGYKSLFMDMFAGDFGHCTEAGNRLLAENIAAAMLRGVFGR